MHAIVIRYQSSASYMNAQNRQRFRPALKQHRYWLQGIVLAWHSTMNQQIHQKLKVRAELGYN
jgi:hypothetical protein